MLSRLEAVQKRPSSGKPNSPYCWGLWLTSEEIVTSRYFALLRSGTA